MKFEQLLKIICKRYFVSFFFCFLFCCCLNHYSSPSPTPHLPACLSKQWYWPQCKQTHRAAMKLIMFPKHIFGGLIPIAGSWVFIFLLFSHCTACSKTLMMLSEAAVGVRLFKRWRKKKQTNKKIEMCVTLDAAKTLAVKMLSRSQVGNLIFLWIIWGESVMNRLLQCPCSVFLQPPGPLTRLRAFKH